MTNYVKFLKGTPSAFSELQHKDKDTLYFIAAENATYGKLYLGDVLIASSITSDGKSIIDSLGELIDVKISKIYRGQVLGYNGSEWVPMTLPEAVLSTVMVGASSTSAGVSGLVPAPSSQDYNKFLRGDGQWVAINGESNLKEYVTKLEFIDKINILEQAQTEIQNSLVWKQII